MSHGLVLQTKCRSFVIYVLIGMVVLAILLVNELPIRVNMTNSMPRGIYFLTNARAIHVSDLVMVCLDDSLAQFALARGYLSVGHCGNGIEPLLKQVVALGGDWVKLETNSVMVNGNSLPHSATLSLDILNRSLPFVPRGIYILKANQLWLYGTESAKSWDSRYFGMVDRARVVQSVKPLLIWSGRSSA